MPYISKERRKQICFKDSMGRYCLNMDAIETGGDLNYCMYLLGLKFLKDKGKNYANCAEAMAAYTGSFQEFYRRQVAPYENRKVEQNGDIGEELE